MSNSTIVTKEAISKTKIGIRTSFEIWFRKMEIVVFEAIKTKVVAKPSAIALTTLFVTASSGHRPNSATKAWLLFHKPFFAIFI